jgi:MFS family permease
MRQPSSPPIATETVSGEGTKSRFSSLTPIPRTVWILGWMMFLINLAFVMIYSLSGVYLKTVVGVATVWIGLLEGVAEGASYAMKLFSGMASDYLKRRKLIMVWGYALMVLSKPVLAMSHSFGIVFCARLMERFGNGIQATPRDALVGDIAPKDRKGACYGLKRSLGTFGSCIGGVVSIFAIKWTDGDFNQVFWLATIPATFAFLILIFAVRDPKKSVHSALSSEIALPAPKRRHPIHWADFSRLGRPYWMLMIVVSVFMLARVSETFLVLHAHQNFDLPLHQVPLIMILYNATYSLSSYPVGLFSDRMNRYWFLAMGIVFLIAADLLMASANSLTGIMIGVALWGVQMGAAQNVFLALIAEMVPEDLRGTGFGFFYLIGSITAVLAGLCAGSIAGVYGEGTTFLVSGIVAAVSLVILGLIMGYKDKEEQNKPNSKKTK